jgi:hypothetical protein
VIFQETTRRPKRHRRDFGQPEIIRGNEVTDAGPRGTLICPFLTPDCQYVGFNGNRKRRGCGYLLLTNGGWLAKAGYDRSDPRPFLDDLAAVTRQLGLIVVGLVPQGNRWFSLEELLSISARSSASQVLRRVHLRVYAEAGCIDGWNSYFHWSSAAGSTISPQTSEISSLTTELRRKGIKQAALAHAVDVDPSQLSKILRAQRPCPDGLLDRANAWLTEQDQAVRLHTMPVNPTCQAALPTTDGTAHLEFALAYLARGWSIAPQIPGKKRTFIKWKPFEDRRPTEQEVRD